jgi:hypothetical protein
LVVGGRATYYRYARPLRPTTPRPLILLRHNAESTLQAFSPAFLSGCPDSG